MGEYAKFNGHEIKIGTCECMYYIRYEDRSRVQAEPNSVDPATQKNLFWRLPFPDEDHLNPGDYPDHNRGVRLFSREHGDFREESCIDDTGNMQMTHPSGLLANIKCYHGLKLPESSDDAGFHWNGKSHSFELVLIKNTTDGIRAVYHCRHCRQMWSTDEWETILPYILDEKLRERLSAYSL